jgi:C terminal of Calcineurin-like phosphoesterase/Calcineurin-like phosphoesterase
MRQGHRRRPNRRELIAGAAASLLTLRPGLSAAAAGLASGHVFHDRHGTGRRMPGDPGVPGVMVSNGREVVLSDQEGRWRLPAADRDSIFVIKPSHWAMPLGTGGVPRITAEVAGSSSIDFGLSRQPEKAQFEAVLMADTQPANSAELGYLCQDIITGILGSGAAFGINHGDVVFDDLSLYARYLQILSASGIPWHHCPGNHDIDREAANDQSSRDSWQRVFGRRHYAFQYANATFIILDNVYYHGHTPGDPNSGRYCGRIGAEQLTFVRNLLGHVPHDRLVVVCMHIPLMNYQTAGSPADTTADRRDLLGLLSGRPHTVSFAGHMHVTEHHYLGAESGFYGAPPHHHHVLTAASGGWWSGPKDARGIPTAEAEDGNPNGYHMLSVDGSHYATRFVPAAGKPASLLRASVERPLASSRRQTPRTAAEPPRSELVVNVFDGGPITRVSYSIAGVTTAPCLMQRIASPDPHVARVFAAHPGLQKPWMHAAASSHIWRAPLPAELRPGTWHARVHAQDEYGRRLTTHLLFDIAASDIAT